MARLDRWLTPFLSVLGAMLPPIVIPLLAEFISRRKGRAPRPAPLWPWLSGAVIAFRLAVLRHPLAMTAGFLVTGAATAVWQAHGGPRRVPHTSPEETKA